MHTHSFTSGTQSVLDLQSEDHGAPREALRLSESSLRGSETNICCSGFQTSEGIESPRGLFKCTSRVSDSISQGLSPRICLSNKFPGDADIASPGATLNEPDIVLGTVSHR